MIRIEKPSGPKILTGPNNSGSKETKKLKEAFDNGTTEFEFKGTYRAKSVKKALVKAQYGKCCFCESHFDHISYGDVEHFRPKGGWVQSDGDTLTKPGYYWLAYNWENLFASCQLCNQRFKKNHFPLVDSSSRARSHHDKIADESSILPHPVDDDPEEFVTYNSDGIPVAINGNTRGLAMIRIFGLDRQSLVEQRRDALTGLDLLKEIYLLFQEQQIQGTLSLEGNVKMEELEDHFKEITSRESEYSVLKKAFLIGVI